MFYSDEKLKVKIQELKNAVLDYQAKSGDALSNYDKNLIAFLVKEIDNPESVKEGMYKIPHKILYDDLSKRGARKDIDEFLSGVAAYREYDGTMPKEKGEALEKMYMDESKYLFVHNIDYKGYGLNQEELREISGNICRDGLRLTTMGNEVGKIDYTTVSSRDKFGMLGLMPTWSMENGVIALQIPKEKVENREAIIGSDSSMELSPQNPGAVLPEYVVGYVDGDKFVENSVPMEERQQRYPHKFSEKTNATERY